MTAPRNQTRVSGLTSLLPRDMLVPEAKQDGGAFCLGP